VAVRSQIQAWALARGGPRARYIDSSFSTANKKAESPPMTLTRPQRQLGCLYVL